MKKKILILFLISFTFFANVKALIISSKELAAELKSNKELVVIDVLAADVYAKQHIKGAINIPHKELYKQGGFEGQLKEPEELARLFGARGVGNASKIIIYDDGSQKYNSRVWWILKYLGATDVNLFHKDMAEMEQARIPLTNVATTLKPMQFIVALNPGMNIMLADLKEMVHHPSSLLIDAREKDEYEGIDKEKRSKGHLPGAVWMNFKEVLTPTGEFKSKEDIINTAAKYGAVPEKEIVVYCQTGIKAATVYVALHEIAGFSNIRLYAGAYAEWASMPENPFCDRKLVSDHN